MLSFFVFVNKEMNHSEPFRKNEPAFISAVRPSTCKELFLKIIYMYVHIIFKDDSLQVILTYVLLMFDFPVFCLVN